jgi:hypothetical protein
MPKAARTTFKPQDKSQLLSEIYSKEPLYKKSKLQQSRNNHRLVTKSPATAIDLYNKLALNSSMGSKSQGRKPNTKKSKNKANAIYKNTMSIPKESLYLKQHLQAPLNFHDRYVLGFS